MEQNLENKTRNAYAPMPIAKGLENNDKKRKSGEIDGAKENDQEKATEKTCLCQASKIKTVGFFWRLSSGDANKERQLGVALHGILQVCIRH